MVYCMKKNCLDWLPNSLGDMGSTLKMSNLQLLEGANKIFILFRKFYLFNIYRKIYIPIDSVKPFKTSSS